MRIFGIERLNLIQQQSKDGKWYISNSEEGSIFSKGSLYCKWCGAALAGRRKAFCSDLCSSNYNHEWCQRFDWTTIRMRIIKRDHNICQECKKKFHFSNLEVHHINPRSLGGYNEDENLITLCIECHRKETDALLRSKSSNDYLKRKNQKKIENFVVT